MGRMPKTAGEFLDILLSSGQWSDWVMLRGDPPDDTIRFRVATDVKNAAVVFFDGDELFVILDDVGSRTEPYEFQLSRFRESEPKWSWLKQVRQKTWRRDEHIELLERLDALLPPKKD